MSSKFVLALALGLLLPLQFAHGHHIHYLLFGPRFTALFTVACTTPIQHLGNSYTL